MIEMKKIKEHLLKAPDSQLDASVFPLIEKWDDEPTSLQILEVLDKCIYGSLASGFVIVLLENLLDIAMKRENVTLDDIVLYAVWRDKP